MRCGLTRGAESGVSVAVLTHVLAIEKFVVTEHTHCRRRIRRLWIPGCVSGKVHAFGRLLGANALLLQRRRLRSEIAQIALKSGHLGGARQDRPVPAKHLRDSQLLDRFNRLGPLVNIAIAHKGHELVHKIAGGDDALPWKVDEDIATSMPSPHMKNLDLAGASGC